MKNSLNYRRFLLVEARRHIGMAQLSRILEMPKHWERHMHYARQAIRMAGIL